MIIDKAGAGIAQLLLSILAIILILTGILSVVGIPLGIGVWVWAIVTVVSSDPKPPSLADVASL